MKKGTAVAVVGLGALAVYFLVKTKVGPATAKINASNAGPLPATVKQAAGILSALSNLFNNPAPSAATPSVTATQLTLPDASVGTDDLDDIDDTGLDA